MTTSDKPSESDVRDSYRWLERHLQDSDKMTREQAEKKVREVRDYDQAQERNRKGK